MKVAEDFDRFFLANMRKATASAQRILRDRTTAEDAALEAMSRAQARWDQLADDPNREAWVLRVAINVALDMQRSEERRRKREERDWMLERSGKFDLKSANRLTLNEALQALPDRQREALVLRYIADLPEQEVAEAMGVSLGSVKTHVRRGLSVLGERLAADITRQVPRMEL